MEDQILKIRRSSNLLKAFMVIVIVMQVVEFYQTRVLDLGNVAKAIGFLCLLRGFLLSPSVLAAPIRNWFKPGFSFAKHSYKYFFVALVLFIVSGF